MLIEYNILKEIINHIIVNYILGLIFLNMYLPDLGQVKKFLILNYMVEIFVIIKFNNIFSTKGPLSTYLRACFLNLFT